MLTERVNGRGAPSVGKLMTIIDSSSDPCPSDVVFVACSYPTETGEKIQANTFICMCNFMSAFLRVEKRWETRLDWTNAVQW